MKKKVCWMLAPFVLLMVLFGVGGCRDVDVNQYDSLKVAVEFLTCIQSGDYETAYASLSKGAKEQITANDFSKKYSSIFSQLELYGFGFVGDIGQDGTPRATYVYKGTYDSKICERLEYDFTMDLVNEDTIWKVDWKPNLIFPAMEWGDTVRFMRLEAKRGEIFAGEEILAANTPGVTVYASPKDVPDPAQFANQISYLLGMSADEILDKFERSAPYLVVLKAYRQGELSLETQEQIIKIPGAGIDKSTFTIFRTYPLKDAFFHVVGYVGKITSAQLGEYVGTEYEYMYNTDSTVGQMGIEKAYQNQLAGKEGVEIFIADEDNRKKMTIFQRPAENGLDVHLTIDPGLQLQTYELLKLYMRDDQTGCAVASNPLTGAVECMVNYPSLDPNTFVGGISETEWIKIRDDTRAPLLNRATEGLYPPGSIFKPLVGAMGIDAKVLTWDEKFPGKIYKDKWTPDMPSWHYPPITRVENKAGICDFYNSIVWSDNIFFAWAAMQLGSERFLDYCEKLGFGQTIPFELPVAKARVFNEGTEFNIKFLADTGYGQGEMLVTPLFANMMYNALSNDGVVMKPYLVDGVWRTDGSSYDCVSETKSQPYAQSVFDPYIIKRLTPILNDTMTTGTGRAVKPPYATAGKTGTAEKSKTRDISWMSVYKSEAPKDFNITVLVDVPTKMGGARYELANSMLVYDKTRDEVVTKIAE